MFENLGALGPFVPLILLFVIFYFMLIRPQQKQQKQRQELLRKPEKGDALSPSAVFTWLSRKFTTMC